MLSGWDECFPTIEPFEQSPVMGELIGSVPEINFTDDGILTQKWHSCRYEATRKFSLQDGNSVRLDFVVRNIAGFSFPFLWASHALFAVGKADKCFLPDGVILDNFINDGTCRKWFVKNTAPVFIERGCYRIILSTDQPYWGVWLSRGGWPAVNKSGVVCLGLEATTTSSEIPLDLSLDAGEIFSGNVDLKVERI